ncbi:MAG TPA: acyltransferase [Acidobacteriaceae bacterium]|jgi:peptidoglycan/LPS O-acetylase OafA/YrhL
MPEYMNVPVAGNTPLTAPENRAFYPALDGMRAVAFTLVYLIHYLRLPWGWSGVNIFFVLSGFLITGILLDTREDRHRARNFYVRRTLRIFPLYYGVMLAFLLLHPLLHWQWTRAWLAWPLYLGNFLRFAGPSAAIDGSALEHAADGWLILGRFPHASLYVGHFWSLCVEEQFYLFWPWVVFLVRNRKALLWICGSVVVLTPIARVVLEFTATPWLIERELLYRFTPLQLDSLLLGALLALLWRGAHRDLLVRIGTLAAPLLLLAAAVYAWVVLKDFSLIGFSSYPYPWWKFALGLSYINITAAAVLLACLRAGTAFHSLLSAPALRWIGRISYGAYVFHNIFHDVYVHALTALAHHVPLSSSAQTVGAALLGYPCTLVIAWFSYRFFESPFLNLKERFTPRRVEAAP